LSHPLDAVAKEIRPLVQSLASVGATGLHAYLRALLATCRVEIENHEILARLPNYILG
jgi:hypothetical protein